MPEADDIILLFDFSMQVKNTKDFVFLSTLIDPIISSFNFVGLINLILRDIVTQGFLFAQ